MKAFISYSHKDAQQLEKLHEHLSALRREGLLETWTDREIHAGGEIDEEVDAAMEEAELFLLLISASFLNSNYCFEREFQRAQEKRAAKTAIIVPLILKEVDWEIPALRKYKALPDDGKPVISRHWHSDDEGFANIAKGLRTMLRKFAASPAKKTAAKKAPAKAKFTPDDTHITIEQKEVLKKLQEEVVDRLTAKLSKLSEEEFKKRRGKWFGIVWSQFNEHFETTDGLPSLPKDQFEAAKSWLLQYRASKDKNFKRVDPQKYRNTLTRPYSKSR